MRNQPPDPADPSHLSNVIEHNIHTIFKASERFEQRQSLQDRIAKAITAFSGSMIFVYVHIAWFAGWILSNTGAFGLPIFDRFPYGLLTMIVSLEAIFLSTFVLVSQNRSGEEADRRSQLHLQIGLLTEHELTRALKMLDEIHVKLGLKKHEDSEDLAELEEETRPEDILAEIDRLHKKLLKHQSMGG